MVRDTSSPAFASFAGVVSMVPFSAKTVIAKGTYFVN